MSAFRLVLPIAELHNSNHRGHWSVGARKRAAMRKAAADAASLAPTITGPVALTVTFGFPDRRPRDLDNYEIKGAIDGAVDAGLLSDDRATVLRSVTRRMSVEKSPKGYAVITFEFVEAGSVNSTKRGRMEPSEKDGPQAVREHRDPEGLTTTMPWEA